MAGKFVLKKSSNGKYHFNLVATNGQIIATSEMYERKASRSNQRFPAAAGGVRAVARPRRLRAGPAAEAAERHETPVPVRSDAMEPGFQYVGGQEGPGISAGRLIL